MRKWVRWKFEKKGEDRVAKEFCYLPKKWGGNREGWFEFEIFLDGLSFKVEGFGIVWEFWYFVWGIMDV